MIDRSALVVLLLDHERSVEDANLPVATVTLPRNSRQHRLIGRDHVLVLNSRIGLVVQQHDVDRVMQRPFGRNELQILAILPFVMEHCSGEVRFVLPGNFVRAV